MHWRWRFKAFSGFRPWGASIRKIPLRSGLGNQGIVSRSWRNCGRIERGLFGGFPGCGLCVVGVGELILAGEFAEDAVGVAGEHAVFFECDADAAAKLADGPVLLGGQCLEDYGVDDLGAADGIDAEYLWIG